MSQRLIGKVAIVTGGSSWIGKEIAKTYAEQGASVFIVGRDEVKLKLAATQIVSSGGEVGYIKADVSQESAVRNAVDEVMKECGQIDILVQNAAIYPICALDEMRVKDWQRVIDVNLTGSFIMLKAVSPIMQEQQQGKIIFISSVAGEKIGLPGLAHYTASKAGMNGLMRTAALELAKDNIMVNSIEPGNIFNDEVFTASSAEMREMLHSIPLGRLGRPSDVANLALFLGSDEATFITGQNFVVDGGETIN